MEPSIQLTQTAFTPEVGLRGVYTLKAPFNRDVTPAIYTCTALRRISSLISMGEDVYVKYYAPYGVELNDYDTDVNLDRSIVTIVSDGGAAVHFPVGYLESYPNMNGEVYQVFHLLTILPPVPRDTDFDILKNAIQEVVQQHLGIPTAITRRVEASELQLVPNATHAVIKAQRAAAASLPTPTLKAAMWQSRYEALLIERDALLTHLSASVTP